MKDKRDLAYYKDLAEDMIEGDRARDKANQAYDDMDHSDWNLPEGVKDLPWVRKVVNTDPSDSIAAAVRVLASLTPAVKFQPLASNIPTRALAHKIEKALAWQLASANRRRQGSIEKDIVRSAAKYDEVAAQVIDLDYQISQKKMLGQSTNREKALRRLGRFAVMTYHPSSVHVKYTAFGPEAVVLCREMSTAEVILEWGNVDFSDWEPEWCETVTLYDYTDYDTRCVWVCTGTTINKEGAYGEKEIMPPTKHGLPFLPWICRVGGDSLEAEPAHRRRPLLYSIYTSGEWETANILNSLMVSEAIAHSAAPRFKEEGANPDQATVDYGDPARITKVPAGNVMGQLMPPPLDQALAQLADRFSSQMGKSTVSRVLMDADLPSGTSFATLNLATQTATGALKPSKLLAEQALADVFSQMLLWCNFTGKAIESYGSDETNYGEQYIINPNDFDVEALYLTVELTPDIPLDKQARANTAAMLTQSGLMSKETAMGDLGIQDPRDEMKRVYFENLLQQKVQQKFNAENQQIQMELQMQAQQMQMQQQQAAQMAAQQMQGPPGLQPGMMPDMNMPGVYGAEGQAFNPAAGGMPPQMMNPGATYEGQTGQPRGGMPQ